MISIESQDEEIDTKIRKETEKDERYPAEGRRWF
jgi:hypothetical protein